MIENIEGKNQSASQNQTGLLTTVLTVGLYDLKLTGSGTGAVAHSRRRSSGEDYKRMARTTADIYSAGDCPK